MRMRAASSGLGRGGRAAAPAAATSSRLHVSGTPARRGRTDRSGRNALATALVAPVALLGTAFGTAFGTNHVAGAAPYPPTTPCGVTTYTAYVDADSVGVGLSAWGFVPGDRVDVAVGTPAVRSGTYGAGADGSLRAVLDVPRAWAGIAHTIRASSASGFCDARFRAIAGARPGPRPGAPGRPGAGSSPGADDAGSGGSSGSPGGRGATAAGLTGSPSGAAGTPGAATATPAPVRSESTGPAAAAAKPATAAPSFIGVPAWLIALISLGLLVIGLLAARALTGRRD